MQIKPRPIKLAAWWLLLAAPLCPAAPRRIVFLAGDLSHPAGKHEYIAGCYLLQKCLADVPDVTTAVYTGGWPKEDSALDGADAIVCYGDGYMYANGAPRHPLLKDDHLAVIGRLMAKGVGLGLIHWSLEPTPKLGEKEFIDWIGGAFEVNWSVNPMWKANFTTIPEHPVTRGVHPFGLFDEWHFHFRFPEDMRGVTPILEAVVPKGTLKHPDGLRSGNPAVRAEIASGQPQILMWVKQRDDGGRGFGFAGGHSHVLWKNEDQRKVVLNAILWIAHAEIPEGGVQSTVTDADLKKNVDMTVKRAFVP